MRLVYEDDAEGTTWAGYHTFRAEDEDGVLMEMNIAPEQAEPLLEDLAQGALDRLLGTLEEHR